MIFDFKKTFIEITGAEDPDGKGYPPYQWQMRLFQEWHENRFRPIAIPSGLGKSSVMVVWLLALANQAASGISHVKLPRRFVYVVDRRTVIDQSTDTAEAILHWLEANPEHAVTRALSTLSVPGFAKQNPLSISTLRGDHADKDDWKRDPTKPAIIVGTVYRIGSRMLFWGDDDGRTMRSMNAGLLGQDVLIVLDEAHLSPAFSKLIQKIQLFQGSQPGLKPFRYVELSDVVSPEEVEALLLPDEDRTNSEVVRRMGADKTLVLERLGVEAKPSDRRKAIIGKALSYKSAKKAVLIYVTSPEEVANIARVLQKKAKTCETRFLIGMLRGNERDELARSKLFRQFLRKAPIEHTIYLVSTAVGEMSVEMDADVGIFDLSPIDSFVRRAGQINRSGGNDREGKITLIYADSDYTKPVKNGSWKIENRELAMTLKLLQALKQKGEGLDASHETLSRLMDQKPYPQAITPMPRMRKLEPYLLDTWAMTEPKPRIGPAVSPWVLGITEYDPSITTLVWRQLPGFQGKASESLFGEWLSAYPIRIAERARLRTVRAEKYLEDLSKRLGAYYSKILIPIINRRNEVVKISLGELQYDLGSLLSEATVILPADLGGLSADGIPDASCTGMPVEDVADITGKRECWELTRNRSSWNANHANHSLRLKADSFEDAVIEIESKSNLRILWMNVQRSGPDENADIVTAQLYLTEKSPGFPDDKEAGAQAANPQQLDTHLERVSKAARAIGEALGLDASLVNQLAFAGAHHDSGKNRDWWQQAAGNFSCKVLAKCQGRSAQWHRLHGYRHELGSLLDLIEDGVNDDLILHLVASHHGRSRPGFDERAFDNTHSLAMNEMANLGSQLRFERLQRKYGWWGLAYLEALMKCADVIGSREMEI